MTIKAIVTDVEGTTTSISFVHEVLFPYARSKMASFIETHHADEDVAQQMAAVSTEVGRELSRAEVIAQLISWIDEDKKAMPLKMLQGLIWKDGYVSGDYRGHVYADAFENLTKWQQQGVQLYVYSSGSVAAQKLIFGYSDFDDMTPLFSGYFDTHVGGKRESASYANILREIDCKGNEVLFLSDIVEELDAAAKVGMQTLHLVREAGLETGEHPQVGDFNEIDLTAM
jgi:enolase-phosphatase E1